MPGKVYIKGRGEISINEPGVKEFWMKNMPEGKAYAKRLKAKKATEAKEAKRQAAKKVIMEDPKAIKPKAKKKVK